MQRPAKPCTPVRFRPPPPLIESRSVARVVKLVDTADLKSAAYLNKGRAGSIPAPGTNNVELTITAQQNKTRLNIEFGGFFH